MLDIGGEFLKMVEEDWGKKPRKTLSFLIGVFIAVVTIHFTYGWLIHPVYEQILHLRGQPDLYNLLQDKIAAIAISVIVLVLCFYIANLLFSLFLKQRLDSLIKKGLERFLGLSIVYLTENTLEKEAREEVLAELHILAEKLRRYNLLKEKK